MLHLFKKSFLFVVLWLFAVLLAAPIYAQDLTPQAKEQIRVLMEEKASRTPAQKKIDSHILLAYKLQVDPALKRALPEFKNDLVTIKEGKVKVDIKVASTKTVISKLQSLGAEIIFSSETFKTITANIPLLKVEEIAALPAVLHIDLWLAPIHNDDRHPAPGNSTGVEKAKPVANKAAFGARANTVATQLNQVFGPKNLFGTTAGAVTSQADKTHKADVARATFGVTGAGVKIGVLSDGVDGYANSQASGDLPSTVTILPGQAGSGSEGRAMLELIHDLAPGADLYFATAFGSQAGFAQNILDLRAAGCDIIVDDVFYFAEGVFQDDNIAQAVNSVTASGALYFSSAGNEGNVNDGTAGAWEGDFVDGGAVNLFPGGTVHNFGSALYNTITAAGYAVFLKWGDPLGASANDYDLFLTNATGTSILASSTNIQDGDDNPYEKVGTGTNLRVYIVKKTGAAVRALHLNGLRGRFSFNTSGVTGGHSAAVRAYSVAATPAQVPFSNTAPAGPFPNPFNSSNKVETFSSDGPRRMFYNPDGTPITPGNILFSTSGGTLLQKPDITAADGTSTNTPGFTTFYGTSAAAPHAAAIAALIKSKFLAITPEQMHTALIGTAIDIEGAGVDRDAGAGIIMAYEALEAAGATGTYIQASSPVTITAENAVPANNAPDPGETVTVSLPLINTGNQNTTNLVATLQANSGVTNPGGPQHYGVVEGGGSSVSMPFTFKAAGTCGDIITLILSLQDGGDNLGTVSYTLRLGTKGATTTQTFSNTTPITIPGTGTGASAGAPANPYPSNINVSGLTGKITRITVGLKQINHTWPGDIDVLLVSPAGQKMIILSDVVEGGTDAVNVNLVLDDAASGFLPPTTGIVSGTFKPTNNSSGDAFPAPAPAAPYQSPGPAGSATLNETFGDQNANGTWQLFVVDDNSVDAGNFNGGWELTITTTAYVCSEVPPGPTESILSVSGDNTICNGSGSSLQVAITGGTSPYTVVYSDGSNQYTVNDYTSGSNIQVSPNATTTYSLVSVTDANSLEGANNSGTPTVTVNQPTTWYRDADGDGYGNEFSSVQACDQPTGFISAAGDCNDDDPAVNPAATEVCDGIDNDCDGQTDEGFPMVNYYRDADGDGYGTPHDIFSKKMRSACRAM